MRPFHNHFGVPARFPAPLAVNPALYANLSSQTPHMRVYLLTNAARDDFMAKFPALGFADTLSGSGQDRAWREHGQSYVMAAWEAYFEGEIAAAGAASDMARAA